MKWMIASRIAAIVLLLLINCSVSFAADPAVRVFLDPAAPLVDKTPEPTSAQVAATLGADGLTLSITAGPEEYPGVVLKPNGAPTWDLSAFGHLEANVTNLGAKVATLVLQPECDGDWHKSPWSSQSVSIKPGETRQVVTTFNYIYGKKYPSFQSAQVKQIRLFSAKAGVDAKLMISGLQAAGIASEKPPMDPNRMSVWPDRGVIFDASTKLDPKQITTNEGTKATVAEDGKSIRIDFSAGKDARVTLKPRQGMWNLSRGLELRIKFRNTSQVAAHPAAQLQSRRDGQFDNGDLVSTEIAPGAEAELVVPFAAKIPWNCPVLEEHLKPGHGTWTAPQPGTGNGYRSNQTTAIVIFSNQAAGVKGLQIDSIICDMPPLNLPSWLGQRPPVEGEWTKTFDENFEGNSIDLHKWNIYTDNYWDKNTHFTKDNVIVKDGRLTLRVEHKRGRHNDDPKGNETDYATGVADTYGKWTQRYGYFEAKIKIPQAPNMFYAFWLMPDRGLGKGPQWKRADTGNNGMEFDIFEGLSIWGSARHDFGCHWDGYDKNHKSCGMFNAYCQPDADGFITVGMLWTPGLIVLYDNGVETCRWESPRISSVQEYFIIDNVTGGWETEGMDDEKLPGDLVVKYVRAWQRKDLASAEDGPKPNQGTPEAPTELPQTMPAEK